MGSKGYVEREKEKETGTRGIMRRSESANLLSRDGNRLLAGDNDVWPIDADRECNVHGSGSIRFTGWCFKVTHIRSSRHLQVG